MPRRPSPKNKTSELASLNPQPGKKRRSKSSAEPAGISVLSADIASPPVRKPRKRIRKTPQAAIATANSASLTIMADQPAMLSEHPAIHESASDVSMPSVPVHLSSADFSSSSNQLMVIKARVPGAAFFSRLSAGITIAAGWYRASLTWAAPHIDRLRKIDLRPLSAALLRMTSVVARTAIRNLHGLSGWLLSGSRHISRINPRVAVALVSFAAFGLLLTRVSPESETGKIPHIAAVASVEVATPQARPARQQPEKREAAVAARMIDAPSRISNSCEKQAWPYVTASCLTMAADPVPPKIPAPEASPADSVPKPATAAKLEARVLPASTSNAQAMISPDRSSSLDDDKPSRREVAKRRHHEGRRHARTERRRNAPLTPGVSEAMAFAPLRSSNTPW